MRILVSTASRHGSTTEIAARIAGKLRAGLPSDVVVDELSSAETEDPASYDAVVLGSAVYMGRWLDDARKLVERVAAQSPRRHGLAGVGRRLPRFRRHRCLGYTDRLRAQPGGKRNGVTHRPPPARIDRTSPSDLMQLASDLPGSPMQVAAVLVFGAASVLDLEAVRSVIGQRLHTVPRLRQCLIRAPFGGGRPIWVDDPDFDIRAHVSSVDCPVPGDQAAMLGVVADITSHKLARNRPLWSATLITSLSGGGAALTLTLHHVLADGIGGLAVLARLVDGAAITPDTVFPRPPPSRRTLIRDAAATRRRALLHLPAKARQLRSAITELTTGGVANPPSSSLSQPIGALRGLAVARADLASVRRVAHAHGATVNDVILTAVTGALHGVLCHRGESVDRFVISVPISGRRSASAGHLGNEVGVMTVPVTVAGGLHQRLAVIARTTRLRRRVGPNASAALLGPVFRTLAWLGVFRWFVNRQHLVSTMVTNVRGPDVRMSFLAVPIVELIPVSPITGNVTVAFAVLSYAGTLVITVMADPQCCPDLPVLVARLQGELDLLAIDQMEAPAAQTADRT